MKIYKKWDQLFTVVVLTGFLFSFNGCSDNNQEVIPSDPPENLKKVALYDDLQKILDNGVDKYGGKGISVAVILPDGSKWVGASGISHGSISIKTDMYFGVGGITSNFTAAALLRLAEEGALNLDDSLDKWLPSFPNVDGTITIRQLLNHTSGLNDIADNLDFWAEIFRDPSRSWNPEEIIFLFNKESVFPKGTDWNYSTTGYILLQMIIQNITRADVCSVYNSLFFTPYDLSNTFASMGDGLPAGTAHGWFDMDNDGNYDDFYYWPRTSFASGLCGEVFSTADDLAKWIKALYRDKTVINQKSLDQMLFFHSPCTGEEYMCAGYGLGTIRFNPDLFNGLEAIGHSGNTLGYAAACFYLPDYDICIGLVDNTEGGNSMYLVNDLINLILNYLEK